MFRAAIASAIALCAIVSHAQPMNVNVIPEPRQVAASEGVFTPPAEFAVAATTDDDAGALKAIAYFGSELEQRFGASYSYPADPSGATVIFRRAELDEMIELGAPEDVADQAYRLVVEPSGVAIEAATPRGFFYGVVTLLQLLDAEEGVAALEIFDYPDLPLRGISDDISRGQVSTVENFKRIIDLIAFYKMNVFMPYLEDMVVLESYPDFGEGRGALTKEEIAEIVEYADARFVEVIPVFQTLGHYENLLADEKYLHLAEFPGSASLCVTCEETYEFLETVLPEVFAMFPSEYFNIGADESFDVGKGKSRELVEEVGVVGAHLRHYERVFDICRKHGKKPMMYGDVLLNHPEILDSLTKDVTIVDWHYGAYDHYPSAKTFDDKGFTYIVSPSVWNFTSTFPVHTLAMANIKNFIEEGLRYDAAGMINSNWGDFGAETIKETILFGYAYSAACSWNAKGTDAHKFSEIYFDQFFGDGRCPFERLYRDLSHPYAQVYYHRLWRHPGLPFRAPAWWSLRLNPVAQTSWLEWTLPRLREDVDRAKKMATRNKDHVDILEATVDFTEFFKRKLEIQLVLKDMREGRAVNIFELTDRIDAAAALLTELKQTYREIWTRYYKPANLDLIEDKFDRLVAYFEEIKLDVQDGELEDYALPGDFVYAEDADSMGVHHAVFSKTLTLEAKPDSAIFQLIGDTRVRLTVNGEFLGEQFVKRSLSLGPEYKRVGWYDVAPYLRAGENEIEIEAWNYDRLYEKKESYEVGKAAGAHIVGVITAGDETRTFVTDSTWTVRFGDEPARPATTRKYRFDIAKPNFETGRKSWIER